MSLFWKLVDRGIVKTIKLKTRFYISTNDLDPDGKLMTDYLVERKARKAKKDEPKGFGWK